MTSSEAAGAEMVDWDLAVRIGSRLVGHGPVVDRDEAVAVVAELRGDAERSTGLVRDFTGLSGGPQDPADAAPVLVIDRPGWVQANTESFRTVIAPVIDKLATKKGAPSGIAQAVGSRVTGAEVGALLGFLGSKVLGQFDPFGTSTGRLLLVAPNIVHVERELDVDPTDFRLWVCLHEETHRVQFTAVPWMREHMISEIATMADTLDAGSLLDDGLSRITEALKSGARGGSLVEIFGSPAQKEMLDRMTGVMSLLEGHADVVMDGVGPEVIPSVEAIRKKFTQRRKGVGTLDRILRRLLGLEAKMAQYRDGAAFVRTVVDTAGMAEFNAVWESPANLPTKTEISDPKAWMARVLTV